MLQIRQVQSQTRRKCIKFIHTKTLRSAALLQTFACSQHKKHTARTARSSQRGRLQGTIQRRYSTAILKMSKDCKPQSKPVARWRKFSGYTVLRTSAIQNRTVDPWKRARPQNTSNVSQLQCSLPVLLNWWWILLWLTVFHPLRSHLHVKFPNGITSRQLLCSAYSLPDKSWPLIGRRTRPWLDVTGMWGCTEHCTYE